MTPCEEALLQTELALEQATNDLEAVRALMRKQALHWVNDGWTWGKIKETPVWEAFRLIGGS